MTVLTIDNVLTVDNSTPMSSVIATPDSLQIRLTTLEKVTGLLGDLDVPRSAVVRAEAVGDGLAAARGVRAPGLGIPGRRKVGTWRRRGGKTFVVVRRGEPALRLELSEGRYRELLVGTPDAERLAATL